MLTKTTTYLRDMTVGSVGRILGYDKAFGGYRGKLISMGLLPGTQFTVISIVPQSNSIEISLRGLKLSLRKQEADALCIEDVTDI